MSQQNIQPTYAIVKNLSFKKRLLWGAVMAAVVFAGLMIFIGSRILPAALFWASIVLIGYLVGVDEWTKSIIGPCPHCGQEVKVGLKQEFKKCDRCEGQIVVRRENLNYKFYPKS